MDSSPPFRTVLTRASVPTRPQVDGGELQPELQPRSQRPASPAPPRRHGQRGIIVHLATQPLRADTGGQCTQPCPGRTSSAQLRPCPATSAECHEPPPGRARRATPRPRGIRHQPCRRSRLERRQGRCGSTPPGSRCHGPGSAWCPLMAALRYATPPRSAARYRGRPQPWFAKSDDGYRAGRSPQLTEVQGWHRGNR